MALTTESFNANGSQRSFTVSSTILSESHVRIHFYYDELDHGVNSIDWDLLGNVILFKEAPTSGYVVKITVSSDGSGLDDSPSSIENVATYISDVITVSESINSVNSVSNNLNGTNEITTVANDLELGSNSEIRKVNNNKANIDKVVELDEDLTLYNTIRLEPKMDFVASKETEIDTISTNISDINTVSQYMFTSVNPTGTNISKVISCADNMSTLVNLSNNYGVILNVNNDLSQINTVSSNISKVTTVSDNSTNVTTVANNIASVNTVATNQASINRYANEYFISSTEPSSPIVGMLWFDSANGVMKVYDGASWLGITADLSSVDDYLGGLITEELI